MGGQVDQGDDTARAELFIRLTSAETVLSSYREALIRRLDRATAELVARYHEDPTLCLIALADGDRPDTARAAAARSRLTGRHPPGCAAHSTASRRTSPGDRRPAGTAGRPTSSPRTRTPTRRCPRVLEVVTAEAARVQPLPRHGATRADAGARRALRRARRRTSRPAPARSACCSSCVQAIAGRATRWSTPGGRSRPTRSWCRSPARRRCTVPLTADERHDLDAMAGGDHRPHPAGPGLLRRTTRPARRCAGPSWSGSSTGCRATCSSSSTRPTASSSATPTCPTASTSTATGPTSWCCGRSPRPTAWPGCGSGTPSRTTRSPRRCARPRCRSASAASPRPRRSPRCAPRTSCSSGSERWSRSASRVSDALRDQGWRVPDSQANFVWLRLGERTDRVRRGLRGGRRRRPPVRRRGRPGHDRRARGQRPLPAGRRGLRGRLSDPELRPTPKRGRANGRVVRLDHLSYAAGPEGLAAAVQRLGRSPRRRAFGTVACIPRFGTRNFVLPLLNGVYLEVVEPARPPGRGQGAVRPGGQGPQPRPAAAGSPGSSRSTTSRPWRTRLGRRRCPVTGAAPTGST